MQRTLFSITAAAVAFAVTSGAAAQDDLSPEGEVIFAAEQFFAAIRNPDKTTLREMLLPEGMILIHNGMRPANPAIVAIPVADHLAAWESSTARYDERMTISSLNVDGNIAHVWGPYRFLTDGETTHCGFNSLSMVLTDNDGWKVANTSFSMIPPDECDAIGAPEVPQ